MGIQNDPRNKIWIVISNDISKWTHILMGDWNSEASEVNIWMETQGLTNTIFNLHRYFNYPIKYQRSKELPIDSIYWSASLVVKQGGFLSFEILVGDHQALWIEINENRLLGFFQHDIIHPKTFNLCVEDPKMIKRYNDTLHTIFVKHDIYQKIHYIYVQYSYPIPTHLAQSFEN